MPQNSPDINYNSEGVYVYITTVDDYFENEVIQTAGCVVLNVFVAKHLVFIILIYRLNYLFCYNINL